MNRVYGAWTLRLQRGLLAGVLALGLAASLNAPIGEPKFGVFRM